MRSLRMAKRVKRTQGGRTFQVSQKRPIDKNLVVVSKNTVDATQVSTTLITATFPCTITGLRWQIATDRAAGTGTAEFYWAIILVKDGNSANTVAISDGATFYEPEQNVLAFGLGSLEDSGPDSMLAEGNTKTMRKLMGGDTIVFIVRGVATNTVNLNAIIQFFCKS